MFLWDFTSTKKTKLLIPLLCFLASAGRPGRSTAAWSRPTVTVDRRAQTCTPVLAGGRSTDPVDRPESSALWKGPGRPSGRPYRETCSLYPGLVDRPVDRWHNGLKYDRWPVDRTVDRQAWQTPTASFSDYKMGHLGAVLIKIFSGVWASFSHFIKRVFSTKLRANTSNQKGRFYQECLKEIPWVFLHHSHPCFSHTNTWAIHWLFIL